jgi:hypothetical protein
MTFRVLAPAVLALVIAAAGAAHADKVTPEQARQICSADFQKYCPNVQPGGGAIRACIRGHFMSFTKPCRRALWTLRGELRHDSGGAGGASPS